MLRTGSKLSFVQLVLRLTIIRECLKVLVAPSQVLRAQCT
jgi:hypothetical protein